MKKLFFLFSIILFTILETNAQTCNEKLSFAPEFNGANQFGTIPDRAALNAPGSGAITIEMWIRPNNITTNTFYSIYRKENDGVGRQLIAFQNDNATGTVNGFPTNTSLTFGLETIVNGYQELDVLINPADFENKWNHIAAVYDGAAMRLYVNGTEIGSIPASNFIQQPTISRPVYLGAFDGTVEHYNGRIDQVRMWSIALNSTQLNAIKDSCTDFATLTANADTTKLHTYLQFNEGGTHLNDEVYTSNITLTGSQLLQSGVYTDEFIATSNTGACNGFGKYDFNSSANWLNNFSTGSASINDNLVIKPSNPTIYISNSITIMGSLTVLNGNIGDPCSPSNYTVTSSGTLLLDSPNFAFTIFSGKQLQNYNIFRLTENANMTVESGGFLRSRTNSKTYMESTGFSLNGNWYISPNAEIYSTSSFNMTGSGMIHSNGIFKNDITVKNGLNFYINKVNNFGVLTPNSIATTTFEDSVDFTLSNLFFDITSATSLDKIIIADQGKFDGVTLNVNQVGNNINVGDRFKIIEATNGFNGAVNFTTTNLPPNFTWNIEYNTNDVTLVATACTTADNTPPTVTSLTNITANILPATGTFIVPDYTGLATVTDNCDTNPTLTQTPVAGTVISSATTTTVTVSAEDASNNIGQQSFTLTTVSKVPVAQTLTGATTFTCPQDNTLTLQNSETNFNYFLRNDATKAVIGNAQTGTASTLNFQTGTVSETTNYHVFAANPSYALNFDGTDDYVEIPHDNSLNFSTGLTIEAWIYPTNITNGFQEIFRKENTGTGRILLSFQDNGTTLAFGTHTDTDGYTELDVTIDPADYNNQWVHVLAFFDDATNAMRIYRNGVEIGNKASNGTLVTPPNPSAAYIGSLAGTTEFFQGKIASLRIWNTAPSNQEEVDKMLLEGQANLFTGNETGLVAYYPFFESASTQLADVTTNSNNGTINGATWDMSSTVNETSGVAGGVGVITSNIQTVTRDTSLLYVDINATGNNNGCDWANAFTTLHDALALAVTGNEIRVASGTYFPTSSRKCTNCSGTRDAYFLIDQDIILKGSYNPATNMQEYNNPSILSADIGASAQDDNTYHVLITNNLTNATIIDGFSIRDGFANGISFMNITGASTVIGRSEGGGMNNSASSPSISNLSFENNIANNVGGAIFNIDSSPSFANATFQNNSSQGSGGAIYNFNSLSKFTNVTFLSNMASGNGGAIYNSNSSSIELTNNTFINNTTFNNGGTIYNQSSSPILYNTVFYFNFGGNSTIIGNINPSSSNNASDAISGGIDQGANFVLLTANPFTNINDIDGADNVIGTADDGLVPLETGVLIDGGNTSLNTTATDLTGNTRTLGANIDIGAYEFQSKAILSSKVFLQGAMLGSTDNLMRDDLRTNGYLPTTSPYSDALTCNVSVFNTGGTTGTGLPEDDIVDWVYIELRDETDNTQIITATSALLQRDGNIVDVDGISPLEFLEPYKNYFVTVKHRNHLGVLTSSPITLNGSSTVIDFTNETAPITFGSNAQTNFGMPSNTLGLWAGNVNGDTVIQYSGTTPDSPSILSEVLNDPGNFLNFPTFNATGYNNNDVDMNGGTQYSGTVPDTPFILQNALAHPGNFLNFSTYAIQEQLPEN